MIQAPVLQASKKKNKDAAVIKRKERSHRQLPSDSSDRVIKQALPRRIFMRPFESRAFQNNFVAASAEKRHTGLAQRTHRGRAVVNPDAHKPAMPAAAFTVDKIILSEYNARSIRAPFLSTCLFFSLPVALSTLFLFLHPRAVFDAFFRSRSRFHCDAFERSVHAGAPNLCYPHIISFSRVSSLFTLRCSSRDT